MPGLDGTGPNGTGPMTGGGFGVCTGARRRGAGNGRGMAYRRGAGCGNGRAGYGRGMAYRRGPGAYPEYTQDYIETNEQYNDAGETDRSVSLEAELEEARKQNESLSAKVDELSAAIEELKDNNSKQSKKAK